MMLLEKDNLGRAKHAIHAVQAIFIFVAWALTLAILTKPGFAGGQIAFIFALIKCFVTVPALIYQVAVPIFPRARRFASVYAYAIVDILFTLLWFSAAVAVAAWTAAGIGQAKETEKDSDGTCKFFAFGDTTKCNVSRASTAFGFLVCFLFASTTAISVSFVRRYRQTGEMPGEGVKPSYMPTDAMGKGAWSATVDERSESFDEPDERRKYGQIPDDDAQGLLKNRSSHGMRHSSDPHPGSELYLGGSTQSPNTIQHYDNHVPSALSPGGYGADRGTAYRPQAYSTSPDDRLDFPAGNYDRV